MRLCRYDEDRLGVVLGDRVHDVTAAQDEIRKQARYDMQGDAVIAALPQWRGRIEAMAAKTPGRPLSTVALLSPVARPSKVMAAPTNYKKHVEEMLARKDLTGGPRPNPDIGKAGIFLKANSSVVGASEGSALRFPERSTEHEIELVMIIGKQGSNIARQDFRSYVAGYALGIDLTCRGPEDRSFRKSLDGYSPVGPWMVSADEIADPDDLSFTLHCNDELRQSGDTRDLVYSCGRLIEFASQFYTLYPGDLYFTGTPQGVAPVKAGDILTGRSDVLGELKIALRQHSPHHTLLQQDPP